MTPSVAAYLEQALAKNTQNSYRSGWSAFTRFCSSHHIPLWPIHEDTLLHFFASLADKHLRHGTLKVYVSAIAFHAKLFGHAVDTPTMHRLHYLLMGIRRSQAGWLTKPLRKPITTYHMVALRAFLKANYPPHDARMLWAACTAAFFGLLRSSEYTCPTTVTVNPGTLCYHHIIIQPDGSRASLYLPLSKNDQFGRGVSIYLFPLPSRLCPVSALIHFVRARHNLQGPFFIFNDGTHLTREHIVNILRSAFPNQRELNTHSFRIGGASALSDAGVQDHVIQIMGRWSSDSFLRYIHIPVESLREFQRSMAIHKHM